MNNNNGIFRNGKFIDESCFNFLGKKRKDPKNKREIRRRIRKDNMHLGSRDKTCFNSCNLKLKQNKNRINENEKIYKENILMHDFKDIIKPAAPHNTSQYLIENHSQSRKENIQINALRLLLNREIEEKFSDCYVDIDDICITGGTMKGKFYNNLLSAEYDHTRNNEEQNEQTDILSTSTDTSYTHNSNTQMANENKLEKLKTIAEEKEQYILLLQESLIRL